MFFLRPFTLVFFPVQQMTWVSLRTVTMQIPAQIEHHFPGPAGGSRDAHGGRGEINLERKRGKRLSLFCRNEGYQWCLSGRRRPQKLPNATRNNRTLACCGGCSLAYFQPDRVRPIQPRVCPRGSGWRSSGRNVWASMAVPFWARRRREGPPPFPVKGER